jgi:hypothetical protein
MNKDEYISNKIKTYYKNKHINKEINKNKAIKNINNRNKGGIYLIYDNLKNRIYKVIKENNLKFTFSYEEIFRCSIEELEIYLKNKLIDNMTFENYGEWEVDHIIPVSSFDFSKKENIFKCFNYKNLQPLWKNENRSKFNKICCDSN